MTGALIILVTIALSLYVIASKRKDGSHKKGIIAGWNMFISLLPLLLLAMAAAGLLQVAVPPEVIKNWLGDEAGLKGIIIGSLAGALIPGGPYISFPVIASVFKAGASLGTAVAFITGWAMWSLGILPFEIALVGPRFTLVRYSVTIIFPPLAGIAAQIIFGGGF